MSVGSRVYIRHDEDDDEYHERLVTGFGPEGVVMLSLGEDHYTHKPDMYVEIHLAGPRGGIPSHLRKRADAEFIRFEGSYDADELEAIFKEGQKIAKDDAAAVGSHASQPRGRPASSRGLGRGAASSRGSVGSNHLPYVDEDNDGGSEAGLVWVVRTPTGVRSVGADVTSLRRVAQWRNFGIALADGGVLEVERMHPDEVGGYIERRNEELRKFLGIQTPREVISKVDVEQDARILEAAWNRQGVRYRPFGESVALCEPQEYEDWPLEPPRTSAYVLAEVAKLGYGPTARHMEDR